MRTLAIGDIHGCLTALETLAESVLFTKEDRLIFLGDYVDRGPNSKGVLDFLVNLQQDRYDVTCLQGNHEIMMLEARDCGGDSLFSWMGCGGDQAMASYGEKSDFSSIPQLHWDFLKNLKRYHETENHIFVHAGAAPDISMDEQPDYQLFWEFFDFPERHQSGKTVICGHSSQKNGRPLSVGHAVCIDTHACGENGWLTCLEVNAEFCWRANQHGEVREDSLEVIANSENCW